MFPRQQPEAVDERFARRDWMLDHVGPVHRSRDLKPMPVDRGRLRKPVGEANLQHVADASLDRRPGDLAVEAPHLR